MEEIKLLSFIIADWVSSSQECSEMLVRKEVRPRLAIPDHPSVKYALKEFRLLAGSSRMPRVIYQLQLPIPY